MQGRLQNVGRIRFAVHGVGHCMAGELVIEILITHSIGEGNYCFIVESGFKDGINKGANIITDRSRKATYQQHWFIAAGRINAAY